MFLIESVVDDYSRIRNCPAHFNNLRWESLCNVGLITNKIRLIHCGIVHYNNYFSLPSQQDKVNQVKRVLAACYESSGRLKFNRITDSDEKKEVGEIIGTAVAVEAMCSVSDHINSSNFRKKQRPTDRRPAHDYDICVPGQAIIEIEVKGRQSASIGTAQNACTRQLNNGIQAVNRRRPGPPKYAFITKTPYDNRGSCKLFISDPDIPEYICDERTAIISALQHYTKSLWWSGFYQFAERLAIRVADIIHSGNSYRRYDGANLQDELVSKVGRAYEFTFIGINNFQDENITGRTHIPPELTSDDKIFINTDTYKMGYLIDNELYEILTNQRFNDILSYRKKTDTIKTGENSFLDIMSDGTMFYLEKVVSANNREI